MTTDVIGDPKIRSCLREISAGYTEHTRVSFVERANTEAVSTDQLRDALAVAYLRETPRTVRRIGT